MNVTNLGIMVVFTIMNLLSGCQHKITKAELKQSIFQLKEAKVARTKGYFVLISGLPSQCYKDDLTPQQCEAEKKHWKEKSEEDLKSLDDEIEGLRRQVEEIDQQEAQNSGKPN